MRAISLGVCAFIVAATPAVAHAQENWLVTGEGSGATPLNEVHNDEFSTGGILDAGLYHSLFPNVLLGGRLSAGALPDGAASVEGVESDNLGIGTLAVALRIRPLAPADDVEHGTGLWLEAAGGPGIIDNDVRPVLSPGIGYNFDVQGVGLGPVVRYLHIFEDGDRFAGEDAQIGMIGLEVVLFDQRAQRELRPAAGVAEERRPARALEAQSRSETSGKRPADRDGDGIVDDADQCPDKAEVYNYVNDDDGCPDSGTPFFIENRLVIDEKAFFDYNRATLRPEGQRMLDHIVELYKKEGNGWAALYVKGHADERGPALYNLDLSQRRAQAVEDYLVEQGIPADKLNTTGYGEWQPVVANAQTREEFQMNRRVEFAIDEKNVERKKP